MSLMLRRCVGFVLAVSLVACIPSASVRRGDAASARGDWRAAEAEYRVAVQRHPNDLKIAKKYATAKQNAIATALRTADACKASNDASCIDRELTYVLGLDPGNVAAASSRATARKELAVQEIAAARASVQSNRPMEAWDHLTRARSIGVPPDAEAEAQELEQNAAAKADELARALLARVDSVPTNEAVDLLTQARDLASAAARRNAQFATTLSDVTAARDRVVAVQLELQAKLGAEALQREDYDSAARAYLATTQLSSDAGLRLRYNYAGFMSAAVRAVGQRDFVTATAHLQGAIATQLDRGAAQRLLDDVAPRVYRIRLESILVTPTKPGTNEAWVGPALWTKAAPVVVGALATWYGGGPAGGKIAHDVTKALVDVPPENRPTLVAFIDLPDGRTLRSGKQKGIYVIYGAEFAIYTNKLDARTIRLSVFNERSGGNDSVAVANVPLGQIVSGKIEASSIQGEVSALQQVVFVAEPADSWRDGSYTNMTPQDQLENVAPARSLPTQTTSRVQLKTISLSMPSDGGDGAGPPDPYIEVLQAGKVVFMSATKQDTRSTEWSLGMTELNVAPNEQLRVRLIDDDVAADDEIATWDVPARDFLRGQVRLSTQNGTSLVLSTATRSDRPR